MKGYQHHVRSFSVSSAADGPQTLNSSKNGNLSATNTPVDGSKKTMELAAAVAAAVVSNNSTQRDNVKLYTMPPLLPPLYQAHVTPIAPMPMTTVPSAAVSSSTQCNTHGGSYVPVLSPGNNNNISCMTPGTASQPSSSVVSSASSNGSEEKSTIVHPLLRGKKLRSGKWLPEEEKYSDFIICLFEKGELDDCSHGSTLRAYLSQKLYCAPMRISKKYTGKGIGKLIYNTKKRYMMMTVQAREELRHRFKCLEEAFVKAALLNLDQPPFDSTFIQMLQASGQAPILLSYLPHPSLLPRTNNVSTINIQPKPAVQPDASLSSTTNTSIAASSFCKSGNIQRTLLPTPVRSNSGFGISPRVVTSSVVTNAVCDNATAKAIKEDYAGDTTSVSASLKSHVPAPHYKVDGKYGRNNGAMTQEQTGGALALSNKRPYSTFVECSLQQLCSNYNASKDSNSTLSNDCANSSNASPDVTLSTGDNATHNHAKMTLDGFCCTDKLPDILAGFDKTALDVVQQLSSTRGSTVVDVVSDKELACPCSPTYTSQSFDDLHQLLGKGLSPVKSRELLSWRDSNHCIDFDCPEFSLDKTAMPDLFSAESVALFANEASISEHEHAASLASSAVLESRGAYMDRHPCNNLPIQDESVTKDLLDGHQRSNTLVSSSEASSTCAVSDYDTGDETINVEAVSYHDAGRRFGHVGHNEPYANNSTRNKKARIV